MTHDRVITSLLHPLRVLHIALPSFLCHSLGFHFSFFMAVNGQVATEPLIRVLERKCPNTQRQEVDQQFSGAEGWRTINKWAVIAHKQACLLRAMHMFWNSETKIANSVNIKIYGILQLKGWILCHFYLNRKKDIMMDSWWIGNR